MQLACVHCGSAFTISSDQLGTRGRCPHCHGVIALPEADDTAAPDDAQPPVRTHWWENTISGLASLVIHLILILVFALIRFGGTAGEGFAEDVLLGELPSEQLGEAQDEELSTEEAPAESSPEELIEVMEVAPPIEAATESFSEDPLAAVSPSMSGRYSLPLVTTRPRRVGGFVAVAPVAIPAHQDKLNGISVPTLAIWGQNDRVVPIAQADLLVREVPGARKVIVPGAGHALYMDDEATFHKELVAFLAELPAEP